MLTPCIAIVIMRTATIHTTTTITVMGAMGMGTMGTAITTTISPKISINALPSARR